MSMDGYTFIVAIVALFTVEECVKAWARAWGRGRAPDEDEDEEES